MRWFKTVAWLTLAFWVIQSLAFLMVFASAITHFIVRFFISIGGMPETSAEAFLTGVMKVLSWPIRPMFAGVWADASFPVIILLLALNSLIWACVFGTVVGLLKRNRMDTPVNVE